MSIIGSRTKQRPRTNVLVCVRLKMCVCVCVCGVVVFGFYVGPTVMAGSINVVIILIFQRWHTRCTPNATGEDPASVQLGCILTDELVSDPFHDRDRPLWPTIPKKGWPTRIGIFGCPWYRHHGNRDGGRGHLEWDHLWWSLSKINHRVRFPYVVFGPTSGYVEEIALVGSACPTGC